MEFFLSLLIGVLVGVGVYCVLQPNLMRIILGLIFLSNAANLILFVAGGISGITPPLITGKFKVLDSQAADPVPQALILTAIVIGFGVLAYFLVLCREFYRRQRADKLSAETFE